jgi:hypothetical protein
MPCDEAQSDRLSNELNRELSNGHVLYGRGVRAVMMRIDRDDVSFELDDGALAVVHLTWAPERDPRWPATRLYGSFEEFAGKVLLPDHLDYEGDHES